MAMAKPSQPPFQVQSGLPEAKGCGTSGFLLLDELDPWNIAQDAGDMNDMMSKDTIEIYPLSNIP